MSDRIKAILVAALLVCVVVVSGLAGSQVRAELVSSGSGSHPALEAASP